VENDATGVTKQSSSSAAGILQSAMINESLLRRCLMAIAYRMEEEGGIYC
jgi:hypothetical protein